VFTDRFPRNPGWNFVVANMATHSLSRVARASEFRADSRQSFEHSLSASAIYYQLPLLPAEISHFC
jgi:hypothetical protein